MAFGVLSKIKTVESSKLNEIYYENINVNYPEFNYTSFYNIEIPVIGVCSLFESQDMNEICLDLKYKLEKKYKVITISQDKKLKFAGAHYYNFSKIDNTIESKILDINRFLKGLIINEKPDLLIVSIPGGIGRLNNFFMNSFGVYLDILMKIISFDYFVLNIPLDYAVDSYLDYLNENFIKNFNCGIDPFHINNELLNFKEELNLGEAKKSIVIQFFRKKIFIKFKIIYTFKLFFTKKL